MAYFTDAFVIRPRWVNPVCSGWYEIKTCPWMWGLEWWILIKSKSNQVSVLAPLVNTRNTSIIWIEHDERQWGIWSIAYRFSLFHSQLKTFNWFSVFHKTWLRHQMETFSALMALRGNSSRTVSCSYCIKRFIRLWIWMKIYENEFPNNINESRNMTDKSEVQWHLTRLL